jgi:hypothetical protein
MNLKTSSLLTTILSFCLLIFFGIVLGIPFCSFLQRHLLDFSTKTALNYGGGFFNSASPVMEGIYDFHNDVFFFLVIILSLVSWLLLRIITIHILNNISKNNRSIGILDVLMGFFKKSNNVTELNFGDLYDTSNSKNYSIMLIRKATYNQLLEIIWTIIPSIILLIIALPSFSLLYSINELIYPEITVKIIGNQWYWHYEYSDNIFNTDLGKY